MKDSRCGSTLLIVIAVLVALVILWLLGPGDGRCLLRQGEYTPHQIEWVTGLKC